MRRTLPPRPSLEHLKKQAKDLLDAHQRGEPEALARIRAAVPAFAAMPDEALARAPFALHDAQSAIAREHGFKSWNELREAVAAASSEGPPSAGLLRALMKQPLPEPVLAALGEAWTRREEASPHEQAPGIPPALPLLALRNAVLTPGALAPIHVGRARTAAAITAALAATPPLLAVFPQRAEDTEEPIADALHPVGCVARIHRRIPDGDERAWVVLEGLRWIALEAIDPAPGAYPLARVTELRLEARDAAEVPELASALRAAARELAAALPQGPRLIAILDATTDPARLADLVIANLPVPVDEKARYAAEIRLPERLRIALALAEARPAPDT